MFYKRRPLLTYHLIAIAFLESTTVRITENELTTHIVPININVTSVRTEILIESHRRYILDSNRYLFEFFGKILLLPVRTRIRAIVVMIDN